VTAALLPARGRGWQERGGVSGAPCCPPQRLPRRTLSGQLLGAGALAAGALGAGALAAGALLCPLVVVGLAAGDWARAACGQGAYAGEGGSAACAGSCSESRCVLPAGDGCASGHTVHMDEHAGELCTADGRHGQRRG